VYDRALRYTLGLPVSTTIVGCSTMEELEKDSEVAENYVPLSGPERLALFREVLPLVTPENMCWKATGWNNPVAWCPRAEPPTAQRPSVGHRRESLDPRQ
jgi:hypothetical protein